MSKTMIDNVRNGTIYIKCVLQEMKYKGGLGEWIMVLLTSDAVRVAELSRFTKTLLDCFVAKGKSWEHKDFDPKRANLISRKITSQHISHCIPTAMRELLKEKICGTDGLMLLPDLQLQNYIPFKLALEAVKREEHTKKEQDDAHARKCVEITDEQELELGKALLGFRGAFGQPRDAPAKQRVELFAVFNIMQSLRRRGMNVDTVLHGSLEWSRFQCKEVWTCIKPLLFCVQTKDKGRGEVTQRYEMMHHRNPLRCPIGSLGHYLCHLLFTDRMEVADVASWSTEVKGKITRATHLFPHKVTVLNKVLHMVGKPLGIPDDYTLHCIRNSGISNAGECGVSSEDIDAGVGHNQKTQDRNYRVRSLHWILVGSGYDPNPEQLAAHMKVFYKFLQSEAYSNMVNHLLESNGRSDLLQMETIAVQHAEGQGLVNWFHALRMFIFSWIVCLASRRRDRLGKICMDELSLLKSCPIEMVGIYTCLHKSDDFLRLEAEISEGEKEEHQMGDHVKATEAEMRVLDGVKQVGEQVNVVGEKVLARVHMIEELSPEALQKDRMWREQYPEDHAQTLEAEKRLQTARKQKDITSYLAVSEVESVYDCVQPIPKRSKVLEGFVQGASSGLSPLKAGPWNAVASSAYDAKEGEMSYEQKTALVRENEELRSKVLAVTSAVLSVKDVRTVAQLLDKYVEKIAPLERKGAWRSAAAMPDKKEREATATLITQQYHPSLKHVVKNFKDKGGTVDALQTAVEEVQKELDEAKSITQLNKRYRKEPARGDSESMVPFLNSEEFGDVVREWKETRSSKAPEIRVPTASAPKVPTQLCVRMAQEDAIRYVGIDPGLQTGWAILDVGPGDVVRGVYVGCFFVSHNTKTELSKCQVILDGFIESLLWGERVSLVCFERYVANPKMLSGLEVNFALRAQIRFRAEKMGIRSQEVLQQEWKKGIELKASSSKEEIKDKVEKTLGGTPFPTQLPHGDKVYTFRTDASDALAIVLSHVKKSRERLAVGNGVRIQAPNLIPTQE